MKRFFALALVLVAALGTMTGCRSRNMDAASTNGSTTQTSRATMPDVEEMVPGPEDTISETNGANQTDHTDSTIDETNGANHSGTATDPTENGNSRIRPRSNILPGT